MVGSYPFGFSPNHFGTISGLNAYIAELGDSLPQNSISYPVRPAEGRLFPNPGARAEDVGLSFPKAEKGDVMICDVQGKALASRSFSGIQVNLPTLSLVSGMYFVTIKTTSGRYETHKLVILD
jgi:hypothetical protein